MRNLVKKQKRQRPMVAPETLTKKELWNEQAPNFNFELDEDELLEKALESGFVTEFGKDQYEINNNY